MKNGITTVPEPTLRRLPRYLQVLKKMERSGITDVSSTGIANELRINSILVRKDIECTGIVGRPKTGYTVTDLIAAIETFLNWDNLTDAFLVGVGHLGSAILGYQNFKQYGVNIIAAFDLDDEKVGREIHGNEVLPMEKLLDLCSRMHIHIGVITVPVESAQLVADLMVQGGITAIWNFAPTELQVPNGIIVENTPFSQSLAVLSHKLKESKKAKQMESISQ